MRTKYQAIEQKYGKTMREILEDAYERFGNRDEVAAELGVSTSTISWWLIRCGLRQVTRLERVAAEKVNGVGQ